MKRLTIATVLVALAATAIAGDIANLLNLGFSADSRYFMFAQYGVDLANGKPYAEIYLVDTAKNDFVPGGAMRKTYDAKPEPGQDGIGAFYALFAEAVPMAKKYGIDHLKPGRTLYFLVDGETPAAGISFRDFKKESPWDRFEVVLNQQSREKSGKWSASFGLSAKAFRKDGSTRSFTFGNPAFWRDGVKGYAIRQIVLAPDEKTLVVIVEKRLASAVGDAVRYMVETVTIK